MGRSLVKSTQGHATSFREALAVAETVANGRTGVNTVSATADPADNPTGADDTGTQFTTGLDALDNIIRQATSEDKEILVIWKLMHSANDNGGQRIVQTSQPDMSCSVFMCSSDGFELYLAHVYVARSVPSPEHQSFQ